MHMSKLKIYIFKPNNWYMVTDWIVNSPGINLNQERTKLNFKIYGEKKKLIKCWHGLCSILFIFAPSLTYENILMVNGWWI